MYAFQLLTPIYVLYGCESFGVPRFDSIPILGATIRFKIVFFRFSILDSKKFFFFFSKFKSIFVQIQNKSLFKMILDSIHRISS